MKRAVRRPPSINMETISLLSFQGEESHGKRMLEEEGKSLIHERVLTSRRRRSSYLRLMWIHADEALEMLNTERSCRTPEESNPRPFGKSGTLKTILGQEKQEEGEPSSLCGLCTSRQTMQNKSNKTL